MGCIFNLIATIAIAWFAVDKGVLAATNTNSAGNGVGTSLFIFIALMIVLALVNIVLRSLKRSRQ